MFRLDVVKGTADVSVPIMVIDSGDGTPETGYDHSTSGIDLWYRREGGSEVSITEAALAAWNSAHTDGGVEHGSDGRGRLDLPDAACEVGTDGATYVEYGGTITGMIVIGGIVQLIDPLARLFTSELVGDTGNAVGAVHVPGWTYGDGELADYLAAIYDVSQDETHLVVLAGNTFSSKVATFSPNLDEAPAENDLIAIVGKLPWNPSWDAPAEAAATDGAAAAISSGFTFDGNGNVDANVEAINEVPVAGDGVSPKFGV